MVHRHRRHGRGRRLAGGHLHDRGAEPDLLGPGAPPGERGQAVGAVGLRSPHRVEPEALRLQDRLGHARRRPTGPVAGVQAELQLARHAVILPNSRLRGHRMRQLTSVDAQFLALESARQTGHVAGLALLDPSTTPRGELDSGDIKRLMEERLPLLPPLRWRLKQVPFGLDYPYWIDDPDFDLEYHVRELALAPPPTDAKLSEQVSRIFSRPLDRTRPLWEAYLIHGLAGGHVALLTKIHHAAIDGLSGAEIMGSLLDLSPEGRPPEPGPLPAGDRDPGELEMLARGVLGAPRYLQRVLQGMP